MASKVNMAKDAKLTLKECCTYSSIELGNCTLYTIFLSFLVYFYTDTLGVNAGAVGIVVLLSKFFDGISDMVAGSIIDHTRTKTGVARPWLLRLAVPMGLTYFILFAVPNVGEVGKLVYIFVSYNVVSTVIYTMAGAALQALPNYMTTNRNSRSIAMCIKIIFAGTAQIILSMLILPFIDLLGGGQAGWLKAAAILGTFTTLVYLFAYCFTRERVSPADEGIEAVPLWTAIKALMHNKYWMICLGLQIMVVLHQVSTLTVGVYYAKYILFDEKLVGNIILYHLVPALLIMVILPPILDRGASKRKIAIYSALMMLAGSLVSVVNAQGGFFIFSLALRGIGFGLLTGVAGGMLIETVAYGEWKTGVNTPAVNLTACGVGQKIGSGVGTAVLGIALAYFGYDGLAAAQPEAALGAIRFIFLGLPIAVYIVMVILAYFFKLDTSYPQIIEDLKQRRKGLTAAKE